MSNEPRHVRFPTFELVGPRCEKDGCKGVLVDHVSLETDEFFERCSECGAEFHRMPAEEKIAWVLRVFDRVLKDEESS